MKKVAAILFVILSAVFLIPFTADATDTGEKTWVVDDMQILSEEELNSLNGYAREISYTYRMNVAFFLVSNSYAPDQTLNEHTAERFYGQLLGPDGFVLVSDIDGNLWNVLSFGSAEDIMTEEAEEYFWDVYKTGETYYGGALAYLQAAEIYLSERVTARGSAVLYDADGELPYVIDAAGVLTEAQQLEFETQAAAISEKYPCEVRIITVGDMEDYGFSNAEEFSYSIYTNWNLGYGPDRSCVIFLLSMADRDYDLRVWGDYGQTAFTLYGIDKLLDSYILPSLKNDNYDKAFSLYLDKAEKYLQMARECTPFDKGNDPDAQRTTLTIKIIVTILLPLLVAFIICTMWKNKMRTAKIARAADNYIPAGGFNLTVNEDLFLYRTTTRIKIDRGSSSSSGGGASSGGSGGSSGRSGKF